MTISTTDPELLTERTRRRRTFDTQLELAQHLHCSCQKLAVLAQLFPDAIRSNAALAAMQNMELWITMMRESRVLRHELPGRSE